MFNVTGTIANFIYSKASDKYDESFKIQVQGETALPDGQFKIEILTLNVPKKIYESLQGQKGEEVTLPIGFYCKNNQIITFFPKNEVK